jgi:hypothetical protein
MGKICKTPGKVRYRHKDDKSMSFFMKQTDLGLNLSVKPTCKREFLAQMERMVP